MNRNRQDETGQITAAQAVAALAQETARLGRLYSGEYGESRDEAHRQLLRIYENAGGRQ